MSAENYIIINEEYSYFQNIFCIISDNYRKKECNVNLIAYECGKSRQFVYDIIMRATGKCPQKYIEELRLTASLSLLQKGNSVAAAGRSVGYAYTKTYIRVFKKHFGKTPMQWTRENPPPARFKPKQRLLSLLVKMT